METTKTWAKGKKTTRARASAREAWLFVTSLSPKSWTAPRIVRLYAKRTHMEETFRDLKTHHWGFGLQYARTKSIARLEILLLTSTLATLATRLQGLSAKAKSWSRHF